MTDADKPTDDEFCEIEPYTIEFLAEAIKALQNAKHSTKLGYVEDHCGNAIAEIRRAIIAACGAEEDA